MTNLQDGKTNMGPQVNVGRKYKSRKERPWVQLSTPYISRGYFTKNLLGVMRVERGRYVVREMEERKIVLFARREESPANMFYLQM